MKTQTQIDDALRILGSAQPPSGLEQRVLGRLNVRRGGATTIHFISAAAIAASIAVAAGLVPSFRGLTRGGSSLAAPAYLGRRVAAHPDGAFGAASAVHLPTAPVPVQPTPVSQGRGRARSEREMQGGTPVRVPHGVAVPRGLAIPHGVRTRLRSSASTSPAGSIHLSTAAHQ